jgi:DedD protein
MRFEIRAPGMVLILLGLAGLSGVVFALGLVAGYEMARQTAPQNAEIASVFPAPSPPAVEATPAASPTTQAMTAPVSPEARASEIAPPVLPTRRPVATPSVAERKAPPIITPATAAPSPAAIATPQVARETGVPSERSPEARATSEEPPAPHEASASAEPTKPYNIQIDAVMDRRNAERMSERIRKLGYPAFLVPTTIAGQTWWRVRVGPYPTKEAAQAAQERLRQQYGDAYKSGRF